MWPWKQKTNKEYIDPARKQAALEAIRLQLLPKCPIHSCICYICPCRGKCGVEAEVRASGACLADAGPRIVNCTWNKNLKGEFNAKKKEDGREPGRVVPVDRLDDLGLSIFDEVSTVKG